MTDPLPNVEQRAKYTCGVAAFRSALEFLGARVPPEAELRSSLHVNPQVGVEPSALVAGAGRYGLAGEARTGLSLAEIKQERASGAYVIALIQSPEADASGEAEGHWVGFDRERDGTVYLMDPAIGLARKMPTAEFLKRWHGMWEGKQVVRGGAVVIRASDANANSSQSKKKDSVMSDKVYRTTSPERLGASYRADAAPVAAPSPVDIIAEADLPDELTAVIEGPRGKVRLIVPTPRVFTAPDPDAALSPHDKMVARQLRAYKAPVAKVRRGR